RQRSGTAALSLAAIWGRCRSRPTTTIVTSTLGIISATQRHRLLLYLRENGTRVAVRQVWLKTGLSSVHAASRQPSTIRTSRKRLLLCRFSDAAWTTPSTRAGVRRRRSAKARNRERGVGCGAAGYGGISFDGQRHDGRIWVEQLAGPTGGRVGGGSLKGPKESRANG